MIAEEQHRGAADATSPLLIRMHHQGTGSIAGSIVVTKDNLTVYNLCTLFGLRSEGLAVFFQAKPLALVSPGDGQQCFQLPQSAFTSPSSDDHEMIIDVYVFGAPIINVYADPTSDCAHHRQQLHSARSRLLRKIRESVAASQRSSTANVPLTRTPQPTGESATGDDWFECSACHIKMPVSHKAIHSLCCGKGPPIGCDDSDESSSAPAATVKCPRCRLEFPEANAVVHDAVCRVRRVMCRFCLIYFDAEVLQEHIDVEHSLSRCQFCSARYRSQDMEHHLSVCSERMEPCPWCSGKFRVTNDLTAHTKVCARRTEQCLFCRVFVPIDCIREHMRQHYS